MANLRADMHGRGINGGGKESRCVNGFDSQIVGMPFEGSSLLCRPLRPALPSSPMPDHLTRGLRPPRSGAEVAALSEIDDFLPLPSATKCPITFLNVVIICTSMTQPAIMYADQKG